MPSQNHRQNHRIVATAALGLFTILLGQAILGPNAQSATGDTLKVMTYNIKNSNPATTPWDHADTYDQAPRNFENRVPNLATQILSPSSGHAPDVVGLQEAGGTDSPDRTSLISAQLNAQSGDVWGVVSRTCANGADPAGANTDALVYNKTKLKVVDSGVTDLPTPGTLAVHDACGGGSAPPSTCGSGNDHRTAIWAIFQDISQGPTGGQQWFVVSTHLPVGQDNGDCAQARFRSVQKIACTINQFNNFLPVIVMGDFNDGSGNANSGDDDQYTLQYLTNIGGSSTNAYCSLGTNSPKLTPSWDFGFKSPTDKGTISATWDTRLMRTFDPATAPSCERQQSPGTRMDYIYYQMGKIGIDQKDVDQQHDYITGNAADGYVDCWSSDHFPVQARMTRN